MRCRISYPCGRRHSSVNPFGSAGVSHWRFFSIFKRYLHVGLGAIYDTEYHTPVAGSTLRTILLDLLESHFGDFSQFSKFLLEGLGTI